MFIYRQLLKQQKGRDVNRLYLQLEELSQQIWMLNLQFKNFTLVFLKCAAGSAVTVLTLAHSTGQKTKLSQVRSLRSCHYTSDLAREELRMKSHK